MYFKYNGDQLPEPMFTGKVEVSGVDALVNKGLKKVGDALPDFGLPITIKNPRFNGLDAAAGAKRGSISFRIIVGFGGAFNVSPADLLKLEADMTIYPTGKADFDGPLRVDLKNVVVPIGTTGLIWMATG